MRLNWEYEQKYARLAYQRGYITYQEAMKYLELAYWLEHNEPVVTGLIRPERYSRVDWEGVSSDYFYLRRAVLQLQQVMLLKRIKSKYIARTAFIESVQAMVLSKVSQH